MKKKALKDNSKGSKPNQTPAYSRAGVDLGLGYRVKAGLPSLLRRAGRPEVIGETGGFGGLFDLSRLRMKKPVLVTSIDGVGTKLKLAFLSGRHEVVGQDIVNHCINDIAVTGADPLFFLDYLGMGQLEPEVFERLLTGMTDACRVSRCALIGGETAQMPDFYEKGEYELVGCIVGVVEKDRILTGENIRPGDKVIGFASSGMHTNGYSLARQLFLKKRRWQLDQPLPGTDRSLADWLLAPHLNYHPLLQKLLRTFNTAASSKSRKGNAIFGLAHITGGGFDGNIPRILPDDLNVIVQTSSWEKSALFQWLETESRVPYEELYEVFNMGIGLTAVVEASSVAAVIKHSRKSGIPAWEIGSVVAGNGKVVLDPLPA